MLIYVNGQYVEASEAKISPYDHGYLYGLGVLKRFVFIMVILSYWMIIMTVNRSAGYIAN